jgi:hypothetical protein
MQISDEIIARRGAVRSGASKALKQMNFFIISITRGRAGGVSKSRARYHVGEASLMISRSPPSHHVSAPLLDDEPTR